MSTYSPIRTTAAMIISSLTNSVKGVRCMVMSTCPEIPCALITIPKFSASFEFERNVCSMFVFVVCLAALRDSSGFLQIFLFRKSAISQYHSPIPDHGDILREPTCCEKEVLAETDCSGLKEIMIS